MRRKYIVAVLALLMLGVVSTLALGTFTSDLTETLTTDTTLSYDEASATLSVPNTDTTLGSSIISVEFTVTQSAEQQIDFTATACSDSDGATAINAVSGATYSYVIGYAGGVDDTADDVTITIGQPLTFNVVTSAGKGVITDITCEFVNTGLLSDYNSMEINIEDA